MEDDWPYPKTHSRLTIVVNVILMMFFITAIIVSSAAVIDASHSHAQAVYAHFGDD